MITNERTYRITKAEAEKFREAIAQAKASPPGKGSTPAHKQLAIEGMKAQLSDLEAELHAYDGLKDAKGKTRLEGRHADLGLLLTQGRIARGWTHKDLGERLGIAEQTIQRYEASGYAGASLTKVNEILAALGASGTVVLELVRLPKLEEFTVKRPGKARV